LLKLGYRCLHDAAFLAKPHDDIVKSIIKTSTQSAFGQDVCHSEQKQLTGFHLLKHNNYAWDMEVIVTL
jgi:hypothetical protein